MNIETLVKMIVTALGKTAMVQEKSVYGIKSREKALKMQRVRTVILPKQIRYKNVLHYSINRFCFCQSFIFLSIVLGLAVESFYQSIELDSFPGNGFFTTPIFTEKSPILVP